MFLGIFDGTVGDFAADTVHLTIGEHICGSKVSSMISNGAQSGTHHGRGVAAASLGPIVFDSFYLWL